MRTTTTLASALLLAACGGHADNLSGTAKPDARGDDAGSSPSCGSATGKPIVLAFQLLDPVSIAVSADTVYWANNGFNDMGGSIMSVPICGGEAVTFEAAQGHALSVVTNATEVFWTIGDPPFSIQSAHMDGGAPSTIASEQSPFDLAIDATFAYWTTTDGVAKAPLAGGATVTLASGRTNGFAIAVDAEHVYWVDSTGIVEVPLDGGTAKTIVTGRIAGGVAIDSSSIYWTAVGGADASGGDGAVLKMPKEGGVTTTLAANRGEVGAIAVDATSVYWVDGAPVCATPPCGRIMKVGMSGGSPVTLASGQSAPRAIVVDATSVYWAANGADGSDDGQIMKLTPK